MDLLSSRLIRNASAHVCTVPSVSLVTPLALAEQDLWLKEVHGLASSLEIAECSRGAHLVPGNSVIIKGFCLSHPLGTGTVAVGECAGTRHKQLLDVLSGSSLG